MELAEGLEVISQAECRLLLARSSVGRVAFSYHALPAIIPVTFGLDEDALVIRTTSESRLASTGDGAVVCFEVDELEPALRAGWSVVVTGQAARVTNPAELARWSRDIRPWAAGIRDFFLRIPLTIVEGRRIHPAPAGASHVRVDML